MQPGPSDSPHLACEDEQLRAALAGWLAAAAIDWPRGIEIRAELVERLPDNRDPRRPEIREGMAIQAGPPEGSVRIRWLPGWGEAVVEPGEPVAQLWFTPEGLRDFEFAERGFLLLAFIFLLRRVGWFHVHAATLQDPLGRGWMFVGDSGIGKSTTTALLAGAGWGVATDDIAFLAVEAGRVVARGFQSSISLRDGGVALLEPAGGSPQPRRRKTGFHLQELGGQWLGSVVPEILVFPEIGERTTLEPIPPREALRTLIAVAYSGLLDAERSQEFLETLTGVLSQSRSFRATLGPDLVANPDLLMELAR